LTFDRGTLLLHPPPRGKAWIEYATWDDRVERFRIPALYYRQLVQALQAEKTPVVDKAQGFTELALVPALEMEPYPHQRHALAAWLQAGRVGVVVLPTGAGKTYLAQLAMQATRRSALIVVPTLDLMHQWYAHLLAAFPDASVGLLGGGAHDHTPLLVATYDSAALYAETLGNRYGLVIFDECHHLPSEFSRVIAEYSLAPYRLGLTATPERNDGKHARGALWHRAGRASRRPAQGASVPTRTPAVRCAHTRAGSVSSAPSYPSRVAHRVAAVRAGECALTGWSKCHAGAPPGACYCLWHGGQTACAGRPVGAALPGPDTDFYR
jgi:hypothetical protein